ncbi:MAG TPA: amino acid adenylation domain-containing protein, partial [Blastocatellia bacterium]|nr:amino acid adenylation domain-containing protein [Blastocatellia bacterium]
EIERLLLADRILPFNLEDGPLLRFRLVCLSSARHLWLLTLPAVCADPRSLRDLAFELRELCNLISQGRPAVSDPVQYLQFAEWHNELLKQDESLDSREGWRRTLDSVQQIDLPFETAGGDGDELAFDRLTVPIDHELRARIDGLAARHDCDASVLLQACWRVLIWRLTGAARLDVGVLSDARFSEDTNGIIGPFATYLPVASRFGDDETFTHVLKHTGIATRNAKAREAFFTWDDWTEPGEDPGTAVLPAFLELLFDYQDYTDTSPNGLSIVNEYSCIESFKIRLSCVRIGGSLVLHFYYDRALISEPDVSRIARSYVSLIASAVVEPDTRIGQLTLLTACDRHQALVEFNDTLAQGRGPESISQLIEMQVELGGDRIALVEDGAAITYQRLSDNANNLATHLRALGMGPDDIIGIFLHRGLDSICSILGVLKAGAAYLPLDPSYPPLRIAFMLEDSGASLLLTSGELQSILPSHSCRVICLEPRLLLRGHNESEPCARVSFPESLAYVIYTSGASGSPKGVAISHGNLSHSNFARSIYYRSAAHRFLLLSSLSFDSSVAGLFSTLSQGGTLVLPARNADRDPHYLMGLIRNEAVSHLLTLGSFYDLLLDQAAGEPLSGLETVVVAGEVCRPGLVAKHYRLQSHCVLYNEYGPTEATVWSTVHPCRPEEPAPAIPIGTPIPNTQIYDLDVWMQPVSPTVPGEIYIAGAGVARGYINRPDLTAERFVPDPFNQARSLRLYRTGDKGRFRPDGKIEYLGRLDQQLKIRGYRIETGEIESALREHPAVKDAVVGPIEDHGGHQGLAAYVVVSDRGDLYPDQLKSHLAERLPAYMIPSSFVRLQELPLLPNGKLDRHSLPHPDDDTMDSGIAKAPPTNWIEEVLAGIWAEVLDSPNIGIFDNFLALGGHSLLAAPIISRIRKSFKVELPLSSLFDTPTVSELARQIELAFQQDERFVLPAIEQASRSQPPPLSFGQQMLWILNQMEPESVFYNCPIAVHLAGRPALTTLESSLGEITRRHEILRTSFPSAEGTPFQLIHGLVTPTLPAIDLTAVGTQRTESLRQQLTLEEAHRRFDLADGPLL